MGAIQINKRMSMALFACLAIPFLYVTINRLSGNGIPRAPPLSSVLESKDSSSKSRFPSMADLTFSTGSKSFGMSNVLDNADAITKMVHNETLGFGAILLISLKYRTDRQDAVSLIGSTQGVRVTKMINAVQGDHINEKALPYGEAKKLLPLPYLGSWRSHMDAFKYIVDNRIETALVLEDDIDWDIHVKAQMTSFSKALRSSPLRRPLTSEEKARAPYGLDWDVMHLGTSRNHMAPPPLDKLFYRYHDDYRTPQHMVQKNSPCGDKEFFCWHDILQKTGTEPQERVLFPSYSPVGLVSLAVSLRGAQKLLYSLSWKGLNTSMDFGVKEGCEKGSLRCWSVTPPIMSSWRVNGAGDSDLRNGGKGSPGQGDSNLRGVGIGLGWSARRHLEQIFDDEKDNFWKNGDAKFYSDTRWLSSPMQPAAPPPALQQPSNAPLPAEPPQPSMPPQTPQQPVLDHEQQRKADEQDAKQLPPVDNPPTAPAAAVSQSSPPSPEQSQAQQQQPVLAQPPVAGQEGHSEQPPIPVGQAATPPSPPAQEQQQQQQQPPIPGTGAGDTFARPEVN